MLFIAVTLDILSSYWSAIYLLFLFVKITVSYSFRSLINSLMLFGNLTHLWNTSSQFNAFTTSSTQRETLDWETAVKRLLPTSDWYEPVAKKFKATKTYKSKQV